ncbi:MAG: outer membrane protein OmpA-like peptidoglycan-associated protein [Gammaproteobacteria bacterium]|jgi:outer membrane protein OmpA-like peptidoglycan-associated protein
MKLKVPVASALLATLLVGCSADDPLMRTKGGAAIGAVSGAVIGAITGDRKTALIGAAIGAVAGGAVGNYMDNQQADFEREMADEQQRNAVEIERLKDDTLKLSLDSEISFDVGRADIKPAFRPTLNKLGGLLVKYNRTVVHVVGHTDSDGSDAFNLDLSQRRALAVGNYLVAGGVPQGRTRTEGRGERAPRATNATAAGKQLNRRVEIYVKPVVEGQEQKAWQPPT